MASQQQIIDDLKGKITLLESSCEAAQQGNQLSSHEAEVYRKIVRLVNMRERACSELNERFLREGYDQGDIDNAIERSLQCGLLDDDRYARTLVRSRLAQGRGCRGIEYELHTKGIECDSLEAFIDDYESQTQLSEFERAISILNKKPPRAKNKRAAAFRKLVQKGYSTSIAASASKAWYEEHCATTKREAFSH